MSQCAFCGHKNPAGVELCKGCGARITDQLDPPGAAEPMSEQSGPQPDGPQPDGLEAEVLQKFQAEGKIAAIKLYRQRTSAGLKEAKDAVEALAAKHGIVATRVATRTGCAGLLLLLLAVPAIMLAMLL